MFRQILLGQLGQAGVVYEMYKVYTLYKINPVCIFREKILSGLNKEARLKEKTRRLISWANINGGATSNINSDEGKIDSSLVETENHFFQVIRKEKERRLKKGKSIKVNDDEYFPDKIELKLKL